MTPLACRLAVASGMIPETIRRPRMLGEPPGSPRPLPLVRFADKTLRAFPTPLHRHGPEAGP
jgi:hypothetical protein